MTSSTIRAEHLTVGYGHRAVVDHIDFTLEPGDLLVLIGTNGSGKSTLLKTLAGLIEPVSGNLDVSGGRAGSQPKTVAYLPQHPVSSHTLPLCVHDVVGMGRFARLGLFGRSNDDDRRVVLESMRRTGIDSQADRPLRDLSGGQQQRAQLAQVLTREANVLLLDEPTAGLDITGRRLVNDIIEQERLRGVTVVMATHELSDAERATSVMLLAQRVVAFGPPAEALRDVHLRECFGFTQPH
ncbi:MAG: metal ABC transporter ATP-binding protein [Ilumatobacteraceae bacterium]|jgi:ABC-type Mn2+/Zn2+ transport system ATPase subunit